MFRNAKIEILPERQGNRVNAEVITEKTIALGWSPTIRIENYIKNQKIISK